MLIMKCYFPTHIAVIECAAYNVFHHENGDIHITINQSGNIIDNKVGVGTSDNNEPFLLDNLVDIQGYTFIIPVPCGENERTDIYIENDKGKTIDKYSLLSRHCSDS